MSEEAKDEMDWTNPDAVAGKLLGEGVIEAEAEPEQAAVVAEPEEAAAAEEVASEDDDQPRNDKGQFMPLKAHKEVLEREREKREALETELATLKAAKIPTGDAEFDAYIADLPDDVADVLRNERAGRLAAETERTRLVEEKQQAAKDAEEAKALAAHEKSMAKAPKLAAAYEDPDEQAKIDSIADRVRKANPKFAGLPTPEFYQAVEAEYLKKSVALNRPLPSKAPAVPSSLSNLPGAAPAVSSALEQVNQTNPMQRAAMFAQMTETQQNEYLRSLR